MIYSLFLTPFIKTYTHSNFQLIINLMNFLITAKRQYFSKVDKFRMNILYMQLEFLRVGIFFSLMCLLSRVFTLVSYELKISKLKEKKPLQNSWFIIEWMSSIFLRYPIRYSLKLSDSVRLKIFAATVEAALLWPLIINLLRQRKSKFQVSSGTSETREDIHLNSTTIYAGIFDR